MAQDADRAILGLGKCTAADSVKTIQLGIITRLTDQNTAMAPRTSSDEIARLFQDVSILRQHDKVSPWITCKILAVSLGQL